MFKKAYIICAKCGGGDINFSSSSEGSLSEGSGISLTCPDCGELTGVEEWNEANGHRAIQHQAVDPLKVLSVLQGVANDAETDPTLCTTGSEWVELVTQRLIDLDYLPEGATCT